MALGQQVKRGTQGRQSIAIRSRISGRSSNRLWSLLFIVDLGKRTSSPWIFALSSIQFNLKKKKKTKMITSASCGFMVHLRYFSIALTLAYYTLHNAQILPFVKGKYASQST